MKSFIRNVNENISLKHIIKFSNKKTAYSRNLKRIDKIVASALFKDRNSQATKKSISYFKKKML